MRPHAALVLLTVWIAGCGFFSSKPSRFFSLETTPPAAAPIEVGGSPLGIHIVELPPGIDRREVAVRGEGQRLEVRGRDLWAAPLDGVVLHTLAFNLASRLPEGMVILPGQAKPDRAMRAIDIVFEDFAAGPESTFVLDARWTLRGSVDDRGQLSRRERVTVPLESLDSASVAAGMSNALAMLADRIVAGLAAR